MMLPVIAPLNIARQTSARPVSPDLVPIIEASAVSESRENPDPSAIIGYVNGIPAIKPFDADEIAAAQDRILSEKIRGKKRFQFSDHRKVAVDREGDMDQFLESRGIKYTKTTWFYDAGGLAKTRVVYDFENV